MALCRSKSPDAFIMLDAAHGFFGSLGCSDEIWLMVCFPLGGGGKRTKKTGKGCKQKELVCFEKNTHAHVGLYVEDVAA